MRLYSVYEIDETQNEIDVVLVADKFHWFAALLTPIWCIVHRMWLELLAYVGLAFLLGFVTFFVGEDASWWIGILVAILIGLEAGSIRGRYLERKGYVLKAMIPAHTADNAEYRYVANKVLGQKKRDDAPAEPLFPPYQDRTNPEAPSNLGPA